MSYFSVHEPERGYVRLDLKFEEIPPSREENTRVLFSIAQECQAFVDHGQVESWLGRHLSELKEKQD